MFAVIKTGGKQYKVAPGDTLFVEKLPGEAGEIVALDQVLMLGDDKGTTVGTPLVEGATVAAEVLRQDRHAKIVVFKKKRRKNYRRTHGHRQETTVLQVTEILTGGKKPSGKLASKTPAKTKAPAKAPEKARDEAPAKKAAAKKAEAPKTEAPKTEAKKAAPKKAAAKKPAAKAPAKKTEAKKAAPKKAAAGGAKKAPAKKAAAKKPAAKKSKE